MHTQTRVYVQVLPTSKVPPQRPLIPLMLKKTRQVNREMWSGLKPWAHLCHISAPGQENTLYCLPSAKKLQHIHFFPLIKLRLFKHFCTSSPSWVYWCEKWGQEGCWKPGLFAWSYKIIVCISLLALVYIIIYKCNKSSTRPLLWVYFHINTCKHAH